MLLLWQIIDGVEGWICCSHRQNVLTGFKIVGGKMLRLKQLGTTLFLVDFDDPDCIRIRFPPAVSFHTVISTAISWHLTPKSIQVTMVCN